MSNVIEINETNFFKTINENKNLLIDFFAPWCGPCKMISPMLDKISISENLLTKIGKINVDENPNISSAFGIRKVPSIFFLKDGKSIEVFSGDLSYNNILNFIKKNE